MCRNIRTLRSEESPATEEEITAAALQYVRKVSGYRKPSRRNQAAFDQAVTQVAEATQRLLIEVGLAAIMDIRGYRLGYTMIYLLNFYKPHIICR